MFQFFETSQASGEPILLYRVTYGTGVADFLALTDAEEDITVSGVKYLGRQAIQCPPITASGTLDKTTLELIVALDSPLTELFRTAVPDNVIVLRIMRAHYGDVVDGGLDPAQIRQIWGGRILNFGVDDGYQVTLSCEPFGTSIRRTGLRRPYSTGCPHVLGGAACKVSLPAFTVTSTALTVTANTVTLPSGWNGALPAAKFTRGVLTFAGPFGTVKRTILSVSGNTLVVAGSLASLPVGAAVSARLGCNHTTDDCRTVFDNINNHGGFPWIPTENPVGQKSYFY